MTALRSTGSPQITGLGQYAAGMDADAFAAAAWVMEMSQAEDGR
jgi:hypothetical protein